MSVVLTSKYKRFASPHLQDVDKHVGYTQQEVGKTRRYHGE